MIALSFWIINWNNASWWNTKHESASPAQIRVSESVWGQNQTQGWSYKLNFYEGTKNIPTFFLYLPYKGDGDKLSDALEGHFTLVPTLTAFDFALSYWNSVYISASINVYTNAYEDIFCILVPLHSLGLKDKLSSSPWTTHWDIFLTVLLASLTSGILSYTPLSSWMINYIC